MPQLDCIAMWERNGLGALVQVKGKACEASAIRPLRYQRMRQARLLQDQRKWEAMQQWDGVTVIYLSAGGAMHNRASGKHPAKLLSAAL